jgi:hypothetical protein
MLMTFKKLTAMSGAVLVLAGVVLGFTSTTAHASEASCHWYNSQFDECTRTDVYPDGSTITWVYYVPHDGLFDKIGPEP